ncbi:outer membrane protein/protective antigen OMA87 [Thioflavicoccus mobilis 8321]|uniref:Outer membrane protein/protective antigen OMA87 n=1 Tax=Thioflavicoccus mobilis 8321 TaxID=765912 RepID=L0H127_9GAMM|nr:outer membrane protein/protective antigen OMA87 [Thioflavicoccus mobilis 8321]
MKGFLPPRLPVARRPRVLRPGGKLVRWVLVAFLATVTLPAGAQQWQFEPTVSLGVDYDDNITLDPEDPRSSFGTSARVAVRGVQSTESTRLGLLAGLGLRQFSDGGDLDDVTAFLGVDGTYLAPRSQFQLNLSVSTQSTLTSETETTGVGDPNGQQYRVAIRPAWDYRLDERSSFGVSANVSAVFYEDVEDASLSDYRSGELSLSAAHSLTERAGINAVLSYGYYESQGDDNETENLAFQAGANYQLSETVSFALLFGLRRTEATFPGVGAREVTETSTGPIYSLSIEKRFARGGGVSLSALRDLAPSGAAEVLDTTSLQLGYRYPLSERVNLQFSSRAYRNRQTGGQSSASDRTYADGQLGLSYQVRRSWRLAIDYRHRWQKNDEDPASAQSNAVTLSLAWSGR